MSESQEGNQNNEKKELHERVWEHLEETKAVILQGPPGTGKTYTAKKVVEERLREARASGNGDAGNEGDDDEIADNLHEYQWTSISGEDYDAHEIENNGDYNSPNGDDNLDEIGVIWELVQLHPSYSYENFVRGIEIETNEGYRNEPESKTTGGKQPSYYTSNDESGGINFRESDRTVVQLAKVGEEVASDDDKDDGETPVILVLDEINRCNLSDVLGELILTLEDDKRGDWPVRLQYPPPESEDGGAGFAMPENLYVIGTMNTADQSIAKIDYAIRRRFRFIDVLPNPAAIEDFYKPDEHDDGSWLEEVNKGMMGPMVNIAKEIMEQINGHIEKDRVKVGHSHFLVKNVVDEVDGSESNEPYDRWARTLANRVAYDVLPLLREYNRNREVTYDETDDDENIFIDISDSVDDMDDMDGECEFEFRLPVANYGESQKSTRNTVETAIKKALSHSQEDDDDDSDDGGSGDDTGQSRDDEKDTGGD